VGKPRLPSLDSTDRHYVENTIRARLASPGILRYRSEKKPHTARTVVLAVLFAAALLGALVWLAGRM